MKILFPTTCPNRLENPRTGGELWNREILDCLKENGFNVEVIAPTGGLLKKKIFAPFAAFWFFQEFLKRKDEKPLLMLEDFYLHYWTTPAYLAFKGFRKARKITVVYHLDYPLRRNPLSRIGDWMLTSLYLRQSDFILVDSATVQAQVRRIVPGKKISRIFFPIHKRFEGLPPQPLPRSRPADGKLKLLFVGNCIRRKRVELLFPVMKALEGNATLDIVGDTRLDPEYARMLAEQVRKLGLQNIVFHGRVEEQKLPFYYEKADVFVLPSRWEGLGIVLLEAMLAGLPVIACGEGGIPELVKDRETGFLVEGMQVEAWVAALNKLSRDPEAAKQMGMKGREIALHYLKQSRNFCTDIVQQIRLVIEENLETSR